MPKHEPKGLKQTSSIITIGARVTESAVDTFTEQRVDLQLNPLDNEVFVVLAVNLDCGAPDLAVTKDSSTAMTMTTTSQTSLPPLSNASVIAKAEKAIRCDPIQNVAVAFQEQFVEAPSGMLDYIGIIATNDFFLQLRGSNNVAAKTGSAKVYGYRAKAEASTYAALVQSEVLTA